MPKIIRLTEADLVKLVKRIIKEQDMSVGISDDIETLQNGTYDNVTLTISEDNTVTIIIDGKSYSVAPNKKHSSENCRKYNDVRTIGIGTKENCTLMKQLGCYILILPNEKRLNQRYSI